MTLPILSGIPSNKRKRYLVFGFYIAGFIMMIMAGCLGEATPTDPIFVPLAADPSACTCSGTTLSCPNPDGTTLTAANSVFCDTTQLNNAGLCSCDGTTLKCTYSLCKADVPDSACGLSGMEPYMVGPCVGPSSALGGVSSATVISDPVERQFPNDPACVSGNQPPPPPPPSGAGGQVPPTQPPNVCADRGGVSYTGDVCVCPGIIDKVVICADGTKFDNPTTTQCTPAESCSGGGTTGGSEPTVVCGCGLYGAPSTGMGCSNGVIEECNVATCGCKP